MAVLLPASAKARTTILLNMASIMEKADEQVLPAVYFFIMRSLKCTPSQLGTLTLCRALVQVLLLMHNSNILPFAHATVAFAIVSEVASLFFGTSGA